jgi:hypothetical protein
MPTNQTAANVKVVIAPETTAGTIAAATVTTARVMRITDSQGLELRRGMIESNEKRDDGNRAMARLGGKMVDGSYNLELTVGGALTVLTEAIMRAAYATSTAISFATMTSVTFGTNQVVANAGDWVGSQGLRVGDIFTVTGSSVAGNNDLRTPILAITSLTITVPSGTFTTLSAAATGTITRLRKLVNGTTPTRKSWSIEQYDEDIDLSQVFKGCRLASLGLSLRPNQHVQVTAGFVGMDADSQASGASPYFTGHPAVTTGLSLVADDSGIYKSGTAITDFTGFDLNFAINTQAVSVIGSTTPAEVFDNELSVTGTITGLRSDFAYLTLFGAETEFDIAIVLTEPTTAPKPCFALYLPRVKLGAVQAPAGGGDGGKVETRTLIIGPKVTATGYDATVASFSQSAE